MNHTVTSLTKIANELTEWVEALELENEKLKSSLEEQHKTASVAAPAVPIVSDATALETCQALVKAGALTAEQVDLAKEGFLNDPAAAHRTIAGILEAFQKQASVLSEQEVDLSGGQTVDGMQIRKTAQDDCFEVMRKILNT